MITSLLLSQHITCVCGGLARHGPVHSHEELADGPHRLASNDAEATSKTQYQTL